MLITINRVNMFHIIYTFHGNKAAESMHAMLLNKPTNAGIMGLLLNNNIVEFRIANPDNVKLWAKEFETYWMKTLE